MCTWTRSVRGYWVTDCFHEVATPDDHDEYECCPFCGSEIALDG